MMKSIQDRTGLTTQQQTAIAVGSLSFLYFGAKYWRSRIPSQKSTSSTLNVLIIGASRGIGLSLARQFIIYGDNVIIASSSQSSIQSAFVKLKSECPTVSPAQLSFKKCDVTEPSDLSELYQFAYRTFNGKVDAVINNFGVSAQKRDYLWKTSLEDIDQIVAVNLKGMLLSNKYGISAFVENVCSRGMLNKLHFEFSTGSITPMPRDRTFLHFMDKEQSTPLHIFNMSGAGTYGMATPRFIPYGATKGGYLNIMKSLNKELKMAKVKNVYVHSLSPGMVWTNLLANKEKIANDEPVISDPKRGWIINALTEDATVVTQWMVPKIRGVVSMKRPRHSYEINFLVKYNAIARIMGGAFFGYNKNRFVDKDGMAVQATT